MTSSDDFPGDMPRFPFDDSDADAVFGAASGPDSVPEDLRDMAELVNAARRAGSADELVGEDAIVARIAAMVGEHVSSPESDAHERISVLSKLRTAKLAAATTAMLVLGATAAAAATGTLPSPVHHHAELSVKHVASAPTLAADTSHHETKHRSDHHKPGVFGVVASINGVSDPNTCGTAGGGGSFTLTSRHNQMFIVNIDSSTTYLDEAVTDPSFANVCVGTLVAAKGTIVDTTVTASKVVVVPPRPHNERKSVFGTVASVNGVSDPNTCGLSGAPGSFTLTAHDNTTFTVSVDPSTAYTDKDVTGPSFANVCVGELVAAKGTVVDTNVTATEVFIAPTHSDSGHDQEHHQGVFGTVASVNGVSDPNTCGTAGAIGSFTVTDEHGQTFTVNVDGNTKFLASGVTDPSFADVCVGAQAGAKGDVTDTTVAATDVFVGSKHDSHEHDGDHHQCGCGNKSDQQHSSDHSSDHTGSDQKSSGPDVSGSRDHSHSDGGGKSHDHNG